MGWCVWSLTFGRAGVLEIEGEDGARQRRVLVVQWNQRAGVVMVMVMIMVMVM